MKVYKGKVSKGLVSHADWHFLVVKWLSECRGLECIGLLTATSCVPPLSK